MEKFIKDFAALLHGSDVQITGTLNLTFPKANPNGSDVQFPLTFPDWKNISSIPAKAGGPGF